MLARLSLSLDVYFGMVYGVSAWFEGGVVFAAFEGEHRTHHGKDQFELGVLDVEWGELAVDLQRVMGGGDEAVRIRQTMSTNGS